MNLFSISLVFVATSVFPEAFGRLFINPYPKIKQKFHNGDAGIQKICLLL